MRALGWLLVCLAPAACSAPATVCPAPDGGLVDDGTWDGGPTAIPLTAAVSSDTGVYRFSVPVQIGDAPPIEALLDTGSAGLRVLPDVVPETSFASITSEPVTYGFQSGVELEGRVAYAYVGFGDRTTRSPIAVMHVDSVGCAHDTSYCAQYGDATDAFDGFGAILGVGFRNAVSQSCGVSIGDPIAQLPGRPDLIVDAPPYGADTTGTFTIGPAPADVAAFNTFALVTDPGHPALADGTPAWNDSAIPVCVTDAQVGLDLCAGGLLDCGNPGMLIDWGPYLGGNVLASSGSQIGVTLRGSTVTSYSFVVGAPIQRGLDNVAIEPSVRVGSLINLGTPAFLHNRVYYNHARGVVGVAAR